MAAIRFASSRSSLLRHLRHWTALALLPPASLAAQGNRLNSALVSGGDVAEFQVAPDGSRVVYRADQDVDGVFELFSVSIDGGAAIKLNAPLGAGGSVGLDFIHNFRISPDGSRVVYWADQEEDEVFELFSVPIDGSQAPVRLNGPLVPGGDVLFTPTFLSVEAFAPMTSDGSRVLYVADQDEDEVFELYCAPTDGSQPAIKLNSALVPGGDVLLNSPPFGPNPFWPQVSPGGNSAVYRADQETDGVIELYSVLLVGSRPPVKLDQPLGPDGDVFSAELSPAGKWVVYHASTSALGPIELFRVPLRGRLARAQRTDDRDRLNVRLDPFEAVSRVSISPDGSRVVYQANPNGGNDYQVFSVPSDGGASAALSKLGDGTVSSHEITGDGARVVYHAGHEETDGELFSVPIDGSAERIRISALGYVSDVYELTPDARRVVYSFAACPFSCYAELHSGPIDGSTSAVRLTPSGTTAGAFRIVPGGGEVAYLQASVSGGPAELYATPIEDGRLARKLSASLVPGGNVRSFAVTSAGRVVYLADQESDEVFELFETLLHRPHRPAR